MKIFQNIPAVKRNEIVFDPRRNSIGFLRLVLALAVIFAHAFELGGFGNDPIYHLSHNLYSSGALAVDGFFALSGYLITSSYLRLKSLPQFLWHRVLRLFPAYWAYLVVIGVGLPLLFGIAPSVNYILYNFLGPASNLCVLTIGAWLALFWGWLLDLGHIQQKFLFVHGGQNITPLFSHNPVPNVINGSLWTLGPELRVYIIIGLLGLVGLLRKNITLGLLVFVWISYVFYFHQHPDLRAVASIRLTPQFLAGAVFYFWKPPLNRTFALAAFVIAAIALIGGFYPLVSPLTTVYLLFWLAAVLPFPNIGKKRDYSYGLYIYAFPVQQAIAAYHLNQWGFFIYFLLCIAFTLPLAAASWHLIEKPALKMKDAFSQNVREMRSPPN